MIQLSNQWANNKNYNISFKRIPKNAHTSLTEALHPAISSPVLMYRPFAVLRDPAKRAVSIFEQLKYIRKIESDRDFSSWLQFVSECGFYDLHIFPQSYFLQDRYFLKYQFFRLEEDIPEAFCTWANMDLSKVKHKNQRHSDVKISPQDFDLIQDIWTEDFWLYEKA